MFLFANVLYRHRRLQCCFSLELREKKGLTFKISYYKFQLQWTNRMREMIKEYDELRNIRLQLFEDKLNKSLQKSDAKSIRIRTMYGQFESLEMMTTIIKDDIDAIVNRLYMTNIYMNESIVSMINKYENILNDEIKNYLDLIASIFFKMADVKNEYFQILYDRVKYDVDNPHKIFRKHITDYFPEK